MNLVIIHFSVVLLALMHKLALAAVRDEFASSSDVDDGNEFTYVALVLSRFDLCGDGIHGAFDPKFTCCGSGGSASGGHEAGTAQDEFGAPVNAYSAWRSADSECQDG